MRRACTLTLLIVTFLLAGAPGGACQESRRLLAEARVTVTEVAPAGHWPFLDRPDDFVAAVLPFLREVAR
mgnify:CR=1 FL=1